ncbi:flagellar protein [Lysobacteraceae bacterium NML93-0399]|nr:flagellar protein [Xanthomonadaceae bacterium NML93-0399]
MAINAVGSGLDIPSLVSNLVSSARAPTENRINKAGTAVNAKLSAVGQIKSAMTTLQTSLDKLNKNADAPAYKAIVPDNAGFSATMSPTAVAGTYGIRVESLAVAQKTASAGYAKDATPGAGTLTIAWGDGAGIDVEIVAGATLSDIASAVNKAAAGEGVTATVVTSDAGQHLVFAAAETGIDNALTITAAGGDGGLEALTAGLTETVAASDALISVDGLERRSASNTITDLVPGTVLELTAATVGTTHTLQISRDNDALAANVSGFVTAYNAVVKTLRSTSSYDAATNTAAALTGDSLVRTLQQQLRGQIGGEADALKALGITSDKDGLLSFDSVAFTAHVADDPGAVSALFGKDGSYSSQLSKTLHDNLDSISGSLVLRTQGLDKQISEYEKQLDDLDLRMAKLTDLYTAQFTAMEVMVIQMQSSMSALNGLLAPSTPGS